ncbi:MAG: hypothetical protein A3C82_01710 [Candidatus Wildermuthbacteria bacterium RIFCSPHIGHO2_02_FULL_47_12]|uniref:SWIM-type domain-containing protein n=2 Tax=Parcubacteria group TaxID=1794811 RepID=A0A1G2R382_9BACT|nr:MAG: hypothetical protein A3A24_03475 [Candidatus Buchananbacteria bacterium RIFCSPLOWO2_01_FULL_46_12]OHA67344.1 MAG: hypothetical protein A3C82_01710 [Candidatus Wildermuthbacteria bacterium RIFCSPHIGHO2_02_FULL_47_12]
MDLFSQRLSRYILANTAEDIFWRGVEYAKQGKVQNVAKEQKRLSAIVRGSSPYEVEFRQGSKYLKGYCTCPYALNEDYCKHVVALAVYWDIQNKRAVPDSTEVSGSCVTIKYGFGKQVEDLYKDPLHADLQFLAEASNAGSWVRPHAKIVLRSPIIAGSRPLSLQELHAGLQKIAHIENHAKYDPYFCAGEVSSLLCLAYDAAIQRMERNSKEEYLALVAECIEFYYNTYLDLIDGSDGVWQIPFSRIQMMFGELEHRGAAKEELENLRQRLHQSVKGWGDIFEELQTQFG